MLGRSSASNTQLPTIIQLLAGNTVNNVGTKNQRSHQIVRLVAAREDWLPEGPAEREGRENCGRRFRETDFAAENFQRLGTWQGLGSGDADWSWQNQCFRKVFIHCQYLTNPTLVFRERQPRSKWLNEKNKMVCILVTTRWSLHQIATTQFCVECPNCKRIFVWNRFCAPTWGLHWVSLPLAYTLAASGEGSFCGWHSLSNLGHSTSYMATSVNQRSQTVLVGPNWWQTEFIFVFKCVFFFAVFGIPIT